MAYKFSIEEKRQLIEAHKWDCIRQAFVGRNLTGLVASGIISEAIRQLDEIVFEDMECPNCIKNNLKYQHMSAHDTQIGPLWQFLDLVDFKQDDLDGGYVDWYGIPYASSIVVELHKQKNCEDFQKTGRCWSVLMHSNGNPLKLRGLFN